MNPSIEPLRDFVREMTRIVERHRDEEAILSHAKPALARLLAEDAWLPDEFAKPDPAKYCQYLLHCDPHERFSVVSFVWEPGHRTPIHNHTVWGLVGVLRGAERCEAYERRGQRWVPTGAAVVNMPGDIEAVSPHLGDVHVVSNGQDHGEHPRVRGQHRRCAPQLVRPRDRAGEGVRVGLFVPAPAQPVGPLRAGARGYFVGK
jgi:3-mercaptopropionate dioxygenase